MIMIDNKRKERTNLAFFSLTLLGAVMVRTPSEERLDDTFSISTSLGRRYLEE